MADVIRFRTQDTKASWARKLNALLTTSLQPKLRETPQTMEQWQRELNAAVKSLRTAGYAIPLMIFRLQDPRQLWARKLNQIAAVLQAGTIPTNTVAPAITGTTVVGQTLTASNGTWTGTATITYARQWKRDGVAISGATGATYVLVAGDVGKTITVTVTATNGVGAVSVTSAGRGPVTAT